MQKHHELNHCRIIKKERLVASGLEKLLISKGLNVDKKVIGDRGMSDEVKKVLKKQSTSNLCGMENLGSNNPLRMGGVA